MLPRDSPWLTRSTAVELSVQPGDIVVVQRRDATHMLPVADVAVFA